LIESAYVGDNLALGIAFDVHSVQRTVSRPLTIHTIPIELTAHIEATLVARTNKLVVGRNPFWGASQMWTAAVKHIKTFSVPNHIHSILLNKACIDTRRELRRVS
jgi:hypothetical protein